MNSKSHGYNTRTKSANKRSSGAQGLPTWKSHNTSSQQYKLQTVATKSPACKKSNKSADQNTSSTTQMRLPPRRTSKRSSHHNTSWGVDKGSPTRKKAKRSSQHNTSWGEDKGSPPRKKSKRSSQHNISLGVDKVSPPCKKRKRSSQKDTLQTEEMGSPSSKKPKTSSQGSASQTEERNEVCHQAINPFLHTSTTEMDSMSHGYNTRANLAFKRTTTVRGLAPSKKQTTVTSTQTAVSTTVSQSATVTSAQTPSSVTVTSTQIATSAIVSPSATMTSPQTFSTATLTSAQTATSAIVSQSACVTPTQTPSSATVTPTQTATSTIVTSAQTPSSATVTPSHTTSSETVTSAQIATSAIVTSAQTPSSATVTPTQTPSSATVTSTQISSSATVISAQTPSSATVTSTQTSTSAIVSQSATVTSQTPSSATVTSTQTATSSIVSQSASVTSTQTATSVIVSKSATLTSAQTPSSVTVTSTQTATSSIVSQSATVTSTQTSSSATVISAQTPSSATVTSTQTATSSIVSQTACVTPTKIPSSATVISAQIPSLAPVTSTQTAKSAIVAQSVTVTSAQTPSSATVTSNQTATSSIVSQSAIVTPTQTPSSTTVTSTQMPQPTTVTLTTATSSQISLPGTVTPRTKVSSDETNFLRASNLMFNIVPNAVRALFDRHHPPGNLKRELAQKKSALKFCRGIPSGAVTSADFDITLLMALLRHFTGVNPPVTGWNSYPPPSDTSEEADLVRIRLYRNELAHSKVAKLPFTDFQQMWTDVKDAVSRIALTVYDKEVQELETKSLDQRIPPHIEDQHKKTVNRWRNEDQVYFETRSCQSAITCVRSHSFMTLVGGPGAGKTATMQHIALILEKEGYIITPISDIQEMLQYGEVELKQVFLIDDVLGTFGFQVDKYNKITDYENQIFDLLGNTSKLMMTCRKSVYKEVLRYKSFVSKQENVIDLEGEKNQLTDEEKKSICKSHCTNARAKKKAYENFSFDFPTVMFPLLCKVFASDVKYQNIGLHFFKYPYKCILREIDKLQAHNPLHYVALVMCTLNQNKLSEDLLDKSELAHLKADVLKRCEVKSSPQTWEIVRALSREDGTYTTEIENEFTLMHDLIFEVFACHYGRQNPEQIIKYMSSSFICEKVSVSKDVSDEDLQINIQDEIYKILADRLYKDVCDMNLHDVFMNKCLSDGGFQKCFIQLLEYKSYEEIKSTFIYMREEDQRIVSKGWSVSYNSSSFERDRQDLLVDKRRRNNEWVFVYSVRVVSWIVLYGHTTILQYIINRVTNSGESADLVFGSNTEEQTRLLVLGCCSGDEQLVDIILKHIKPVCLRQTPQYNDDYITLSHRTYTPLTAACQSGHLNIFTKLIKHGSEIHKGSKNGYTPMTAACRGGHLNIVNKLIESGCDINKSDNTFWKNTPLISACKGGHLNIVNRLIESGCDINKADKTLWKYTPLTIACEGGDLNIVNRLIESGCEVNEAGYHGYTPMTAADRGGHLNIVNRLKNLKMISQKKNGDKNAHH